MVNRIELNVFTAEHVAQTFSWVRRPDLQRDFMIRGEITWAGHQAYFASALADLRQRLYAIHADGRHVGNCGFKGLGTVQGEGELWIYIGEPDVRGAGVGETATRLLLQEGTGRLGLHRVLVHVAESNDAARRLYRRIGFIETGEGEAEWENRGVRIVRMAWAAA